MSQKLQAIESKEYNSRLGKAIQSIPASGIRRFFDLASTMKGVVSLGVGEPDFITPWKIRESSISALERGYTSYTGNSGLLELRKEITNYIRNEYEVEYDPYQQIIVTVGASEAIDIAVRAVIDPGDEVLIVEPCYVSYSPIVTLAGGVPVSVGTFGEHQFRLTPEEIEKHVTPRTKLIIFCYPNNPTGAIMERKDWENIAQTIEKHNLLVISDEIYSELTYDQKHVSFPVIESMWNRTILINGFSKSFAMTGWRVGYALGPTDIIQAMLKIHQYMMLCAPIMGQMAAIEALKSLKEKDQMVESYRQRRNYMVNAFRSIGLSCHEPKGAFYLFPSVEASGLTSEQFAEQLLMAEKVAVVPGGVFGLGGEGYVRCSYASSLEQLKEAIRRIERFLDKGRL
jgi:aminotransferase